MDYEEFFAALEAEGGTWEFLDGEMIRRACTDAQLPWACPVSSLLKRRNGALTEADAWRDAADALDLDRKICASIILAADYSVNNLRLDGHSKEIIDLRRRLLAACGLPAEEEGGTP